MSRESLLQAIRVQPKDDVLRLAYADWLDENGTGDLDAATSEFIHCSCDPHTKRKGSRMPDTAYMWIARNWRRLIPSVLAAGEPKIDANLNTVGQPIVGPNRTGRKIAFSIGLNVRHDFFRYYSVEFEFCRGFLLVGRSWSIYAHDYLLPIVKKDQPLSSFVRG